MNRLAAVVLGALIACAAHAQSDPAKTLRVVFRTAETGFDPQAASDLYSNYVNRAIFEPPFRYDFRARPHKVVPNTTVALPEARSGTIRTNPTARPPVHSSIEPVGAGPAWWCVR